MNGRLVQREQLTAAERSAMFSLLGRHFDGVSRAQFDRDLADKNWALLLHDEAGGLAGFSTLRFYHDQHHGSPISVVYSGDTIVDPSAWRSTALSRLWIASVKSLHESHGVGRLYWLLIVSGFRTYRFLPVYWREFYPRHDRATPRDTRRLMDRLATDRFGEAYSVTDGVVRFPSPQRLNGTLQGIPAERLRDPHVAYFDRVNPRHADGDELVCLTELCDDNLTPAGRRMALRDPASLTPEGVTA